MFKCFLVSVWISIFLTAFCDQRVFAQDFPYAVPQAPEFDSQGNILPGGTQSAPLTEPQQQQRRNRQTSQDKVDYRMVRPYVPRDTSTTVRAPQPSMERTPVNRLESPRAGNPAMASTPPPSLPTPSQMEERPDCSQYPMLIARSQSEPEMQMAARRYLTCLLKNGWTMEQARQHVINTIESTFRLAR